MSNQNLVTASPEAFRLLNDMKKTISTPEGVQYLWDRVYENRASIDGEIVSEVKDYMSQTVRQAERLNEIDSWDTQLIRKTSTLPAEIESKLGKAAEEIRRAGEPILINYMIDASQKGTRFDMQYFAEDDRRLPEALSKDIKTVIDEGWFRTHGIIQKGSGIYRADPKAKDHKALLDSHGRVIDVPYDEFQRLLNDSNKGLQAFLKDRGVSVTLTTNALPAESAQRPEPASAPEITNTEIRKPGPSNAAENAESVPSPE
ncbi:MAG: hypothetical protein H2069_08820 [Legionella sp.]|nr:hypothetical protein [Legionella sp.]